MSPDSPHQHRDAKVTVERDDYYCSHCQLNAQILSAISKRLSYVEACIESLSANYASPAPAPGVDWSESGGGGSMRRRAGPGRTQLDPYLEPFLRHCPYTRFADMGLIMGDIARAFPHYTQQQLESSVREWYRKRREYMTHRINAYCDRAFCMQPEEDVLAALQRDPARLDAIAADTNLDVKDAGEARRYAYERISSYFFNRRRSDAAS